MEKRKIGLKKALYTGVICLLACSMIVGITMIAGAANVGRDNEIDGNLWADLGQDVYVINTKDQLLSWAKAPHAPEYEGKLIALGADITFNEGKSASSWASAAPGEKWVPVTRFAGAFDGRGHTISGLYASGGSDVGFFASLQSGAAVRNLSIENSYFKGVAGVAALAGTFKTCTVSNVYSNAIVESNDHAGGILGSQGTDGANKSTVTMTSCWFDGSVTVVGSYASGVLGNQNHNYAILTDCLNTGAISSGKGTSSGNAAGISTAVYEGALTAIRCVNLGQVTLGSGQGCGIAKTLGSGSGTGAKAADGPIQFVNCFNKTSVAKDMPDDVRGGTVIDGVVGSLSDSFAASNVKALSGNWKMKNSIPVPAYFAGEGAAEIPADDKVPEYAPTLSVMDTTAVAGGTVDVSVKLEGNPGISDLSLKVNYDSSVLTLISVQDGGVLNGFTNAAAASPYEAVWSSDKDSSYSGTVLTLRFAVSDSMKLGDKTAVSVSYAEANNAAGKSVVLQSFDGAISAISFVAGDVNRDQVIDAKDLTLLQQYVSGQSVELDLNAADTNGDGAVNESDAQHLADYLAGKAVTLG